MNLKVGDIIKFDGPDHSLTPDDREKWGLVIDFDPSRVYEKWTIQWSDSLVWSSSGRGLKVICSAGDGNEDR